MFEIGGAFLALLLVAFIAFPHLFALKTKNTKLVGSSYWGVYHDVTPTDSEHKIEAPKPGRKWNVVAGSHMYAGRR